MKNTFKTPQSLIKSFATLALMIGPIGSAAGSGVLEAPDLGEHNSTNASSNTPLKDRFSTLPHDAIKAIALEMDPLTFLHMAQVSPGFNEILSDKEFQLDYKKTLASQLSEKLGEDYSAQFQKTFFHKPLHTFGRRFSALMAPDNLNLLLENDQEILKHIMNRQLKVRFPKRFAVSSYVSQFFTIHTRKKNPSWVINTLGHVNIKTIPAIADSFFTFVTEDMTELMRSNFIEALAPLSVEQIVNFTQTLTDYKDLFFTEDMSGQNRLIIIKALAPLSVKEIAEVAEVISDLSDPSPKNILQILREKAQN